ncbi:MAG: YjfB family protein [Betaproteobacteria bacterium]|nr:YjfB family protein [Betaproteobacteria bacterium]
MDVGKIARLAINMSVARTDQAVGIAVLRKALDVQANGAMSLVAALPALPSPSSSLGQKVNATA